MQWPVREDPSVFVVVEFLGKVMCSHLWPSEDSRRLWIWGCLVKHLFVSGGRPERQSLGLGLSLSLHRGPTHQHS